jgi:hypothetical protein
MNGETRSLTEPERRYLEWWAKTGGLPSGPTVKDNLVIGCTGAGCLTAVLYLVGGLAMKILLALAATHVAVHKIQRSEWWGRLLFAVPLVLWIGMLIYLFTRPRKTAAEDPKKLVQQDLTEGVARIHRFRATEVLLAFADERRERHYFVRLDDGRVLFLGPWRPLGCKTQGLSFVPDEKGFPSATFEIAATPNYLLILDVVGTGDFLRPVDEFELSEDADPGNNRCRLEAGNFVKTPWEEIRKTFG